MNNNTNIFKYFIILIVNAINRNGVGILKISYLLTNNQ